MHSLHDLVLQRARVVVAEVGSEADHGHEEECDESVAEGARVAQEGAGDPGEAEVVPGGRGGVALK